MSGVTYRDMDRLTRAINDQTAVQERIAVALERIAYPNIKIETVMQPIPPAPKRS